MKASISDVSPVVIVSLITSFWTLSDRVSQDDKVMFQEEWKSIEFQKGLPCINVLYVIRVFLWRFLEISSRIVLLSLIWINLGGISVFIICGLEVGYLFFVCFGAGTLSKIYSIYILYR